MDRAALKLLEVLDNDEVDEQGRAKFGVQTKMSAFTKAQEWLGRRAKMKAEGPVDDADGVAELRRMIDDPAEVVDRLRDNPKFIRALEAAGWLKEPPKRTGPGRMTVKQKNQKVRYDAAKDAKVLAEGRNDDSQLQALLRKNDA